MIPEKRISKDATKWKIRMIFLYPYEYLLFGNFLELIAPNKTIHNDKVLYKDKVDDDANDEEPIFKP